MRNSHPATAAQRSVLRDPPSPACCMRLRDPSELERLAGTIVYLWLSGGTGFWYQPLAARGGLLDGFALSGGLWRRRSVPLRCVRRYF
jgi:hypothetical protein